MQRPIGSHLVHPIHGPTVLVERRMRLVGSEQREYAVLQHVTQDLTLLLPSSSIDDLDMRPVLSADDVADLLALLGGAPDGVELTWRIFRARNEAKLRTGEINEVAEVVRDLRGKQIAKGLSPTELDMFRKARARLIAELDIPLDEDAETVVDAVLHSDEAVAA